MSEDIKEEKPLPPLFFPTSKSVDKSPAIYAQQVILDALSKGETDPKKLAEIAGFKRVADVYLTLDKLSLRKEFHAALGRAGVSLDLIAAKLRGVLDNTDHEVQLKAISLLLKSIGLEKYEESEEVGRPWEDVVLAAAKDMKETEPGRYEVELPEMPEDLKKKKESEKQEGQELYEQQTTGSS